MATEFFTTDAWGDRVIIQRGSNDANVVIDSDVLIGSANTDAILLTASFHDVLVRGTVSGYANAIRLGDSPGLDYANTLRVAQDGLVEGGIVGAAFSGLGTLVNDGTIFGNDYGVTFDLASGGRVDMTNRGTISGGKDGIWVHSTQDVRVALTNYGTVEGLNAYRGFEHRDLIVNRGAMRGAVDLHEGDDRFDNRGGTVEDGKVYGGGGNDTFLPGDGEDVFSGGDDIDVLDFRSSGGLRVSLADDSGTGVATGDDYSGFEVVWGSRGGADTLIGNWAANTLHGFGGADALRGAGGADSLWGGIEADRLSGGAGNDAFCFSTPDDCGDAILDFGAVSGNNDVFRIDATNFGFVLGATAQLQAGQLQVRADNRAQDADDRFVFRTTDKTLWFDADGSRAGAAVLVADLQDSAANLTAADILLVV